MFKNIKSKVTNNKNLPMQYVQHGYHGDHVMVTVVTMEIGSQILVSGLITITSYHYN